MQSKVERIDCIDEAMSGFRGPIATTPVASGGARGEKRRGVVTNALSDVDWNRARTRGG